MLFPAALAIVVILGTLLVVYARENRLATALERPLAFEDHWHAAFGFYVCDEFLPDLPEYHPPQNRGIHGHGDGLVHVHPFSTARSGERATMKNFISDGGEVLGGGEQFDDDRLGVPGGETFVEGDDSCDGADGDPIVQVAVWDTGFAAADDQKPDRVVTEDLESIRFDRDGRVYTIAFAPPDAQIPPPPSVGRLGGVGSELGVPAEDVPDDAELGDRFGQPEPADGSADTQPGSDVSEDGDDDISVGGTSSTSIDREP